MNTATITPLLHPNRGDRCVVERVPVTAPRERFGGAVTHVPLRPDPSTSRYESLIAVHGGYDLTEKTYSSDMHVFFPEMLQWTRIHQDASWPSARMMHAVCWGTPESHGGSLVVPLYLYGGLDRSGRPVSDFLRFDLYLPYTQEYFFSLNSNVHLRGEWKPLGSPNDRAPAMAGHTLTVRPCNSDLILFGGMSSFNLHREGKKSSQPEQESFLSTYFYAWSKESGWWALTTDEHLSSLDAALVQPCRRSGHAAMITNDKLYIFGGLNAIHEALKDLWEFDFSRESWRHITNFGEVVSPHWCGSGFLSEGRWWMLISQSHAGEGNQLSMSNTSELCIQAYDTTNEVWASSWTLHHRGTISKYPLPYFFPVPAKYREKACYHLKELNSTDRTQGVAFHALSIFTTRTKQHKPALVHVSGSIRQSGFPMARPPSVTQRKHVDPPTAVTTAVIKTPEKRIHPKTTNTKPHTDAPTHRTPEKRLNTKPARRSSDTKRTPVRKGAVVNTPIVDKSQTNEQMGEFLGWTEVNSCQKEECWLTQFGSSLAAEEMNLTQFC